MLSRDRRDEIVNLLKEDGDHLTLKDLSVKLDISIPTLYKDIRILKNQKIIKKFHGGFELIREKITEDSFFYRRKKNKKQKISIAKEALRFIENNETILIDVSTTCYYLCEELKKNNDLKLTIITNSAFIPMVLMFNENYTIINVGGLFNNKIGSFVKGKVNNFLENIHCHKFFASTSAASSILGMMDKYGTNDIAVKKEFAEVADETIFLIDSSKFKEKDSYNWYSINRVKKIISDKYLDKNIIDSLNKKEIEIFIAKEDENVSEYDSINSIFKLEGL